MNKNKIVIVVVALLLAGLLTFGVLWGVNNWQTVQRGLGGADLYTRGDVEDAFDGGMAQGQLLREQLEAQVRSMMAMVDGLNATIQELRDLMSENAIFHEQLQNQLRSLENLIDYYQRQIDNLLNQHNQVMVSFLVNGEVVNSVLVEVGSTLQPASIPDYNQIELDGYYIFGWSLDGFEVVDVQSITISESVSFFAIVREDRGWFTVTFVTPQIYSNFTPERIYKQVRYGYTIGYNPTPSHIDNGFARFTNWRTGTGVNAINCPIDFVVTRNVTFNGIWQFYFFDGTWEVRINNVLQTDTVVITGNTVMWNFAPNSTLRTAFNQWESFQDTMLNIIDPNTFTNLRLVRWNITNPTNCRLLGNLITISSGIINDVCITRV
ncbi:MAG: hypothetical protein FWE01_00755 [Firmicutes bacterium]|nr:hypothetical protein [Bacillota bacterium]